ncbi:MAG: T9SS type A sorting domain-containing protein [Flavobacteriales bacterium]
MKQFLLPALLLTAGALQAQLFTDDFEGYTVGDYISIEGAPAWAVWTAGNEGGAMDSQISDEAALSGSQSMKIFGGVAGGPMDIMLVAGLTGAYEITFNMLIPEGNAGYYNVQENQSPGVAWAFECNLNGDGTVNYNIDGGTYTLDATYTPGTWLKITHLIDTDSDLMHLYYDDVYLGQLPYDGGQIGGVNFYAAGDGINVPTYYIDDVFVDVTDPVVDDVQAVTPLECAFGPNPAQDFVRVQANLDNATVRVLGLDGKVVLEQRRNDLVSGAQLNLDLNNGIYLLELTNGAKRITQRLVIQK